MICLATLAVPTVLRCKEKFFMVCISRGGTPRQQNNFALPCRYTETWQVKVVAKSLVLALQSMPKVAVCQNFT